ncbi:MAG TPA: RES family NAD+ phosphorylase, partial [Longimicrobiaceae bacterium]|nr:RES family NAD+ phosphorylase [Longimicrobiaceae bacterium]
MRVWRIAQKIHPPLDGEGARLFGARWNSPGIPVVYTAGSLALAVVELFVHTDPDLVPDDLIAYEIDVPDHLSIDHVVFAGQPADWARADVSRCRQLGDRWVRSTKFCVL